MSVTDQDLMAFADGELPEAEAARVASAMAADPALGARIEAERRLRGLLAGHFAPVVAEPIPEALTLMIAAAAAEETERDMTDAPALEAAPEPQPARVLDFGAARAKRQAAAGDESGRPAHGLSAWGFSSRGWGTGAAIAASLVLGLALGGQFAGRGTMTERNGALVASGALAHGLDTQLASAADAGDGLRVLASFRRSGGGYCRVFDGGATAGIACREQGQWVLERTASGSGAQRGAYRQAGSAQGDLLAAAQQMAAGDPLDAAQERAARAKRWGD